MNSKHTPPPWNLVEREPEGPAIYDTTGRIIVTEGAIGPVVAEQSANARLIAAAPELVEALRAAKHIVTHYADGDGEDCLSVPEVESWIEEARALLLRVEGETGDSTTARREGKDGDA